MSLLEKAKILLRENRISPRKALGQNFMVDSPTLENIIGYASLDSKDVVLDIGAGFGFLTRLIATKCRSVLAVESDANLVKILRDELEDLSNVKVVYGDVFRVEIPDFSKIVSIPPYHISSRLVLWLFRRRFDCAVLVFQREFGERLAATVGREDYGWLAVVAYYYFEVELLDAVSRRMFYPQPEVGSVVVRLKSRKSPPFALKNEMLFRRLVQSMFTHCNRKVKNAVVSFARGSRDMDEEIVAKSLESFPFSDKRVRELGPEDFGALSNALFR
jgi:16S rRNA (adenine1518-N6/adenine1519-N6)-dimethyltransferase